VTFNHGVVGSSPTALTIQLNIRPGRTVTERT
jgi:hypothetical protein